MRRAGDWLRQAKAALEQAKDSLEDGHYWASCFFSHQAAEYSAKAFLASKGIEARGHSVYELLEESRGLGIAVANELLRSARNLDRHYLQSRYVNTFHSGAPVDYYSREDAERAIGEAERIVELCGKEAQGVG